MMRRRILASATLLLLVGSGAASADTIYLKNGRQIDTDKVEVIGDKLVFLVYGAQVAIPMSLVERVEKNDATYDTPETTLPATPPAVGAEDEVNRPDDGAEDAGAEADEDLPPEENRAYWTERVQAIRDEQAALQEELVALRREERAFLFSRRSTAESSRKIEAATARLEELDEAMRELRREARRLGVPPGWLRGR